MCGEGCAGACLLIAAIRAERDDHLGHRKPDTTLRIYTPQWSDRDAQQSTIGQQVDPLLRAKEVVSSQITTLGSRRRTRRSFDAQPRVIEKLSAKDAMGLTVLQSMTPARRSSSTLGHIRHEGRWLSTKPSSPRSSCDLSYLIAAYLFRDLSTSGGYPPQEKPRIHIWTRWAVCPIEATAGSRRVPSSLTMR